MPRNVHVDTHNGQTDPLAEQNNRSQQQIRATQIALIIYLAHLYQRQGIVSINELANKTILATTKQATVSHDSGRHFASTQDLIILAPACYFKLGRISKRHVFDFNLINY
jgi:hypothetical protein